MSAPTPARTRPPLDPSLARVATLEELRQASEVGGRPRLVNHWATWCEGCVEELPRLVELHERLAGQVDFVGIGWERFMGTPDAESAARRVALEASAHGLGWPTLVFEGEPEELFEGLGLQMRQIPQTFVLDGDGRLLHHARGPVDAAEARHIEHLLAGA